MVLLSILLNSSVYLRVTLLLTLSPLPYPSLPLRLTLDG